MKKLFLSIAVLSTLTFSAVAQDGAKTTATSDQAALTPEQKAEKELAHATKQLSLTDAQKVKFKQFAIDKVTANQALRAKIKGADAVTKESLRAQAKTNRDKFFANVNGILTPEQQTKWTALKAKQEEAKAGNHTHNDD